MPWPFTPPEGRDISYAMAPRMTAEALKRGYSDPVELPLMRKDGSRFMGEVIISPARDADGEIVGWVSTIRDVSKRHDYEVELERLARHDPLTGLPNRRLFDERLDQEMADAIRHDRSLAVAILDLDGFKAVNDRHGHPAGDRALCEAAERLRAGSAQGRPAGAHRRGGVRLDPAGGAFARGLGGRRARTSCDPRSALWRDRPAHDLDRCRDAR